MTFPLRGGPSFFISPEIKTWARFSLLLYGRLVVSVTGNSAFHRFLVGFHLRKGREMFAVCPSFLVRHPFSEISAALECFGLPKFFLFPSLILEAMGESCKSGIICYR